MDNRPIGVFDSGLGGLTVAKEIMNLMPNESIIYFGDTGRVPYGTRSNDTIKKYTEQDIRFLKEFDIKAIVIACGTASSVALDYVRDKFDTPITGVVEPTAKMAVNATKNGKIGLLGTKGTINSGAYEKLIGELNQDIKVIPSPCSLFVPIVENGYANTEIARIAALDYLKPIIDEGADTIILGCTHYPLLEKTISGIMGDKITLINSGVPTAKHLLNYLEEHNMRSFGEARHKYYVSDRTDGFTHLAELFLNSKIGDNILKINIEEY